MNIKPPLFVAAFVATVGFAGAATAGTVTDTFQVKINIQASCDVTAGTASDIDFGDVAANAAGTQAGTSNLSVTCSNGTPYIIGLSTTDGDNGTGTMAPTGTGNTADSGIGYKLWQDASHSTVWGNTGTTVASPGNDYVSTGSTAGDGTGSAQTIPVYATVSDVNHMPGPYADTVTVHVTY